MLQKPRPDERDVCRPSRDGQERETLCVLNHALARRRLRTAAEGMQYPGHPRGRSPRTSQEGSEKASHILEFLVQRELTAMPGVVRG